MPGTFRRTVSIRIRLGKGQTASIAVTLQPKEACSEDWSRRVTLIGRRVWAGARTWRQGSWSRRDVQMRRLPSRSASRIRHLGDHRGPLPATRCPRAAGTTRLARSTINTRMNQGGTNEACFASKRTTKRLLLARRARWLNEKAPNARTVDRGQSVGEGPGTGLCLAEVLSTRSTLWQHSLRKP